MIGGFRLIAWPVEFNSSGIMSFIVGPNRIVYQKGLGLNTLSIAAAVTIFGRVNYLGARWPSGMIGNRQLTSAEFPAPRPTT